MTARRRPVSARRLHGVAGQRGFTLIELSVAIVIMIIAVVLVGVSISNIRRADLKSASGMIAGSMRYLYNLAIINNTPYRLVIDMDQRVFWGEELDTDDPCQRYLPEDEDEDEDRRKSRKKKRGRSSRDGALSALEEGARAEGVEGVDGAGAGGGGGAGYTRRKDNLLTERKLPQGIVVTRVITAHHQEPQVEGRVAVHFFPGGYGERAWVWLGESSNLDGEDDEESVTVALDGLMGRVIRHFDVLDERKFIQESKEREEID